MMVDDETGLKVDGYKLRMSQGKWYLKLYFERQDTLKDYGPFGYWEAKAFAEKFNLEDLDKVDFAAMNAKDEKREAWEKAQKHGRGF